MANVQKLFYAFASKFKQITFIGNLNIKNKNIRIKNTDILFLTFYLPSFFKILSRIDSADGLLDISCFNCVIMKFKSPYEFGFE